MFRIVGYHLPVTCFFPYRSQQSHGSDDSTIRNEKIPQKCNCFTFKYQMLNNIYDAFNIHEDCS